MPAASAMTFLREPPSSIPVSYTHLPEAKAKKLIDGGYAGKNVVFGIRPEEDVYKRQVLTQASKKLPQVISCNPAIL